MVKTRGTRAEDLMDREAKTKRSLNCSPYDLSQVVRSNARKAAPGSTRPLTDDPYSACTVINTEQRGIRENTDNDETE